MTALPATTRPMAAARTEGLWLSIGLYTALALTLVAPIMVALLWSLVDPKGGWFAPAIVPNGLSLHHWRAVGLDRSLIQSIVTSVLISLAVTALSGMLALPTAYALAKVPFRAKRAIEMFILAPLIVPGLIAATGMTLAHAAASSLVSVVVFGAATSASYAASGLVDWPVFAALVAGGGLGALAGLPAARALAQRADTARRIFALMVLTTAAYVAWRALSGA